MSLVKKVKACTHKSTRDFEKKIAKMVSLALQKDFPKTKLAARAIATEIDVNFDAIKRWYNGLNTPISGHFLALMKVSPSLFISVLKEVGREDVLCEILLNSEGSEKESHCQNGNTPNAKSGPINGPRNRESPDSLLRQKWFVDQIRESRTPSISSIMDYWKVSRRKAKWDIASLKNRGTIAFVGAKKNGRYLLL
jgi:hypothetical protein